MLQKRKLQKQSTVGDVINELKTKVELSHPNAGLRLLEVFFHKIYKIPEEQNNLGPHDRLIHVYHFTKETKQNQMKIQNFGEPFFLVIHDGETLADVKVRIQKKLQVPDEEFAKWKFSFLSLGRPEYLHNSNIVSSLFQRTDVYGAWGQYLGLEHSDNAPKGTYPANKVATIANPPQPISDADIEATYSQAEEIARSITNASSSSMSLSSLDEATKQEVLRLFSLIEVPFEELASSRSLELVSCITKIQTISANFFTKDQQQQVNEMAEQIQARVAQVQYYQDEIKAKNDYIASIRGICSSILTNNEKEAKLKQDEEQLAIEELELREKLERVIKQKLAVRQEREKLCAETKDLLIRGENGDTKIQAAMGDLRKAQLKLRSLSSEWDFFGAHFARP